MSIFICNIVTFLSFALIPYISQPFLDIYQYLVHSIYVTSGFKSFLIFLISQICNMSSKLKSLENLKPFVTCNIVTN